MYGDYYAKDDETQSGIALTNDDVAGLQKIIREYDLAALNGIYEETAGLPPIDGDYSVSITYSSGEKIAGSQNGGFGGRQRQGFGKIRSYLEPFFIKNGELDRVMMLYPISDFEFSAPGKTIGRSDISYIQAKSDYYDGCVRIRAAAVGNNGDQRDCALEMSGDGFDSVCCRALQRTGADDLCGMELKRGSGKAEDSFDYSKHSFDPETGEQLTEYRIDPAEDILLKANYTEGKSDGYFFYSGEPTDHCAVFAKAIGEELLCCMQEQEDFSRMKKLTFVNEVEDYYEKEGFAYTLEVRESDALLTGRVYYSSIMRFISAERVPITGDDFRQLKRDMAGLALTIDNSGVIPFEKGISDHGENTLTIEYDDGRVFSKTLGTEEKRILNTKLFHLVYTYSEDKQM